MPRLSIRYERSRLTPRVPHKLFIDDQYIGVMQEEQVGVEMPEGCYRIRIESMIPFVSSTGNVDIRRGMDNSLVFKDREHWWDVLFGIDIICWIIVHLVSITAPWGLIYKVFTNVFFVAWLLYEMAIRKRYYKMDFFHTVQRGSESVD